MERCIVDTIDSCYFCKNPVVREAPDTWKRVEGWVGGPKKDSMRLRSDMGDYAHDECVQRVILGMPPDQPTLFEVAMEGVETDPTNEPDPSRWLMQTGKPGEDDDAEDITGMIFGKGN